MVSIFAFTFLSILISFSVGGLSSGKGIVDLLYSNLSLRFMCVNKGRMYSSGGGSGLGLGLGSGSGLGLARYWFIIWSLCRLSLSLLSFMRMASLTCRLRHVGSLLITSHPNLVFSRSSRGWDLT